MADECLFLLYHAGGTSTGSSGTTNRVNRTWTNEGTITLKSGADLHFFQRSQDPFLLRLNGKAFLLETGRVFVIDDAAGVTQLDIAAPVVTDQAALQAFVHTLPMPNEDE